MPAQTGAFSSLVAPGLRKVFFHELRDWSEEYSQIATVANSTRNYEDERAIAGLGKFIEKDEGKSLTWDVGIEGGTVRYTHVTYALGFRVSREMWQDDLYGIMRKMSRQLARSAKQTVESQFAELINDAFSGSTYTGHDGKSLCNTGHVLIGGGTYANRPSTDVDLSLAALRAAWERMEDTVDERGFPVMAMPKKLLIGTGNQWLAEEILGSPQKPYTGDNEINVIGRRGLDHMVYHYMVDSDAWLLLADKGTHDLKFFWRMKPKFENDDDFDTKDAKFSGTMRFSFGFTDWRGVDGSSGA